MSARPVAMLAVTMLALAILLLSSTNTAGAQAAGLKFPAPAGTQWEVLAGYNTATHEGIDPYALDMWRVDGDTAGTTLLAPFDGEVGYVSDDCISIRTSQINLLLCHVFPLPALERGDPVAVGQRIGTVAPDGQANNNGVAHIHLQLSVRNGDWGSNGAPLAFAGQYALDGAAFPETTEVNAYYGDALTSTNGIATHTPVANTGASLAIDAGPDLTVQPSQVVTLSASGSGATSFTWTQASGPSVIVGAVNDASLTFAAPSTPGSALHFLVTGTGPGGSGEDEVSVTVEGGAQQPQQPQQAPPAVTTGQIVSGEVSVGVNLIVFGGGTNEELMAAVACTQPSVMVWASQPQGGLIRYIPNATATFLNGPWNALFPGGIPAMTPLIVRCQ